MSLTKSLLFTLLLLTAAAVLQMYGGKKGAK